ncbi:hypothetical protein F9279_04075 [Bacillus sp. B1-b2]|nr:hypothetical protein F9279_04075 [Bacillus sp. B1-b2]
MAVAPQIASSILPDILLDFIEENPDIEVIVNIVNSFNIGEQIRLSNADIGICRMEPIQKDILYENIHRDPVILVAPYKKEKGGHFPNEIEILKQYRLLVNNHPTYWGKLLNPNLM